MARINPFECVLSLILSIAILSGCSTTRRLGEDDILYTGVKKVEIIPFEKENVAEDVEDLIDNAVNVAPNNSLISPYYRTPFPIGLWVYNNWDNPPGGLKHWLYEKLVEEPVLISDVRPDLRVKMIEESLDNAGYFRGTASYQLLQGKNKKKAKVKYVVSPGPAYWIDSLEYLPDTCRLYHIIDSVAKRSTYLVRGQRYSTDSLSAERVRIVNVLRDRGYYFFRPEYIEYLADSTLSTRRIALRINVDAHTPQYALQHYTTGNIMVKVNRNEGGGIPDTIATSRGTIVQMMPSRLRHDLIPECVTFQRDKTFAVRDMNRTQTNLSRLGIFSDISISAIPDTLNAEPTLNVVIDCTFDAPLEASIEANVSSKSNSYLGPGLTLSVMNRNLFGGGEQLKVGLTGAYEWQTGRNRSSLFNSYEIGLNASLSLPRLLAPKIVPRSRRYLNWTRITMNADYLNRPHYFKMAQFDASFNYDWRSQKYFTNTFTVFKLSYNKLLNTTATFDSIMDANRAVALSFRNQFVPQMGYSIIYDRAMNRDNLINVQGSIRQAGNLCWAIWKACGIDGEKKLFGMPFSQFFKITGQIVYSRRLVPRKEHWLVSRFYVGAAHAYGNSTEVPYTEQFYVGGANSVRAFAVRSIGPGSYHAPEYSVDANFDQTGTFKMEFNVEYRFPILGPLRGALFVDAGNVWLLKKDTKRPGSQLTSENFLRDVALGTGVGLRFDIGMLVVRGDLGIGLHAPYDTGQQGYFNMPSFKDSLAFHLAIGYPF